jgi:hypothetical protein
MTSLTHLSCSYIDQMMTTKGTSCFRDNKILEIVLDDGIILRIGRAGFAIAPVYFVVDSSAEVPIPNGLVVRVITNNVAIAPCRNAKFFLLAWSDTYSISLNGELITELATQRQWSLLGPPDRVIRTFDN